MKNVSVARRLKLLGIVIMELQSSSTYSLSRPKAQTTWNRIRYANHHPYNVSVARRLKLLGIGLLVGVVWRGLSVSVARRLKLLGIYSSSKLF